MSESPSSPADARVTAALEAVYRAFAAPTPARIEGCPCCVSTRSVDVLLAKPLRDLTGQDLWRYVSGAFLTIGDERDFRYLLPRILDVSVNDPDHANGPEIVLGKLSLANWRSWSDHEQRTIEDLIDAWFEKALAQDLAEAGDGWIGEDAESVLCGAARAGLPLGRWLTRLRAPDAAPALANLRERFPRQLSGFWDEAPAGYAELFALLTPGVT